MEEKQCWLESEDPWQTLAGCMELMVEPGSDSLMVKPAGSPRRLVQWTANYVALGGNINGGKEGNLVPGKKPGDVYLKVAIKVSKLLDFNTTNGHDIAKALKGHIKHKVV
ncbi:DNA-directed RNA polymerase [Puccinia graminis f. sp. tritici]|uniref:DNA-directed RNA polymerase n=1 Tax=Puccinia graminis f. sp. tritici TaxID=56615 RepID=A0A5B0Q324_PUCGR|nr:DNA-directed RNA polymerase [Puccinia graminis f. sp. tritici]KAA1124698.1 DNA-directed RNA polymerase [Puccinia graminis f. sp. tritici]